MIRDFFRKPYEVLNRVVLSESALRYNLQLFRSLHPSSAIAPVLKSNAYGHGLKEVSQILDSESCPYFIVDSLYEAYALKKTKIHTPILVLGYQNPSNLREKLPFIFTASDLPSLEVLLSKNLAFHLEIDTGMKRMGLTLSELKMAIPLLQSKPHLLKGILSHLMTADAVDSSRLEQQEKVFKEALRQLQDNALKLPWIHLGNTAGAPKLGLQELNMARLGIGLYGINPYSPEDPYFAQLESLKPVLHLESSLLSIRKLQAGDAVSYGAQFIASEDMTVGVLPFGYYEGLPIALSNKGWVRYKDHECRIVGRVNMNHSFIDLTGLDAQVGDRVQLYTAQGKSSLASLASLAETIPYELLARLSPTIRRVLAP